MSKKKKTIEELLEEAILLEEEQLYEVPENWVWVKIKGIGNVKGGKRLPKGHALLQEATPYPYLRVADFKNGTIDNSNLKYITKDTASKISRYIISKDDVYISIAGTIGKTGIVPNYLSGANLTENAAKITDLKGTSNRYLHLVLNTDELQNQMKNSTVSTSQPKLALFRIEELKIPLPPLNEQKRIAKKAEILLNKIEEAEQLIDEVKGTFEHRRLAILNKAFRGELGTNKMYEESVSELIGNEKIIPVSEQPYDVPENWVWVNIKHVIESMKTRDPKKMNRETFYYIDVDAINNKNQTIGNIKEVSKSDAPSRAKRRVSKGDVIISLVRPYLKNIALIPEENSNLVASTAFYVCTPKTSLSSRYLYYFLCTTFATHYLIKHTKGDNSPSVRSTDFENLQLPVPTLSEQKRITDKLENMLRKLESEQSVIELLMSNLEVIKQSILTQAIRGELGTNDPTEESAIELIKEMLEEQGR